MEEALKVYDVLTLRVAARYLRALEAMEFPTDDARKEYLKEHPGADPAKHTVKEHGDDKGEGGTKGTERAKAWLAQAKAEVKSFFTDRKARQEGLTKAASSLKEAPGRAGRAAIEAVKKQVAEAKDVFEGIKSVVGGGSMTDAQKGALKRVALKTATTLAATALVAAFPAAIAHSLVGQNVAKHVAKLVLRKVMGQATGIKLAAEANIEEWLGTTLAVAVANVLENLSEDDLQEIMETSATDAEAV